MSRRMVGAVIQALLTDETFRERYVIDPLEALADVTLRGVELTREEIDVFVRTDPRLWIWSDTLPGARLH